ncbi:IF4G2 factor, partial [Polypterus senegalus]
MFFPHFVFPFSSFPPPHPLEIILLKILHCQAAKVESVIAEGGASRFSASSGGGGGRGASQHYPKTVGNSILNKLTPEKFDKLCLELLNVGVDSKLVLKGIILLIVDKALEEPKYSSLYAQLCLRLAEDAPNFDGPSPEVQPAQKQSTTFRRLLITKLQDEFENRTRNVEIYDKHDNPLTPDEEEQRAIAKIKMLGNIKFIGELGKLDLIHESILHKCIKTLLEKKKRVQLKDMGEDLECLCQIMRTVGPRLDHEKAKSLMDQYFARMRSLMTNKELPARIRFLLQDTVELRENNWVPRKAFIDNGPKTINQIRQEAVKGQNQHYHNQNQGHSSQQPAQSKDMPPRFIKKGQLNADEPPQLGLKTNPPPIQEKPAKNSKRPAPAKEELLKMTEAIVTEFMNNKTINDAVAGLREMKAPKHFLPEMLSKIILCSLDRTDDDKEHASTLIHSLRQEGLISGENFMQAFLNVLDQCPKLEVDIPLVKSYLAQFAARAVIAELITIAELAQPLENGTHFPLFLLCLQQTAKLRDREWLTELFQLSKVNMQKMLPEIDQNKDRMLEILEGKGLSFLFPLLKLEKELLKQIEADPSPQAIYKWIKDNISPKLHTDKGFVNILMTSFLQYISHEMSLPEGDDQLTAPAKEQLDQEKQLLLAFKPVMQKFLHDHVDLQVSALYALQVHCNNSSFPKGMLLRFFVNFYDMEIIEEEAFLAWKEDITQEFPGKGKALFQVNQWLTWLETAEEEESEDDLD